MKNEEEEEIEFMISDVSSKDLFNSVIVLRETTQITLLYLTRNIKEADSEYEWDQSQTGDRCQSQVIIFLNAMHIKI